MLTEKQIQERLAVLRVAFDPKSPFRGMINLNSKGGLLTLPIPEQQQVRDAMSPELVRMVFKTKARARNE